MTINVKVTLVVPIEIPDDPDYDAHFSIEENSCPGTGIVWSQLSAYIDECDEKGVCWACNLHGKNEIVPDVVTVAEPRPVKVG